MVGVVDTFLAEQVDKIQVQLAHIPEFGPFAVPPTQVPVSAHQPQLFWGVHMLQLEKFSQTGVLESRQMQMVRLDTRKILPSIGVIVEDNPDCVVAVSVVEVERDVVVVSAVEVAECVVLVSVVEVTERVAVDSEVDVSERVVSLVIGDAVLDEVEGLSAGQVDKSQFQRVQVPKLGPFVVPFAHVAVAPHQPQVLSDEQLLQDCIAEQSDTVSRVRVHHTYSVRWGIGWQSMPSCCRLHPLLVHCHYRECTCQWRCTIHSRAAVCKRSSWSTVHKLIVR